MNVAVVDRQAGGYVFQAQTFQTLRKRERRFERSQRRPDFDDGVAVPVRLTIKQIGAAPIICARTRPKYIGGSRAVYQEM